VVQAKFARAAAEQRALEPSGISSPTLVMASDDDIIHTSHTIEMYQAIPDAQLAIVPARRTRCYWRSLFSAPP